MKKTTFNNSLIRSLLVAFAVCFVFGTAAVCSAEDGSAASSGDAVDAKAGGGYAATGQLGDAGYSSVLYDETNGIPTSEANCILSAADGYIWICGYSGVLRYDGSAFRQVDKSEGLTSGRSLFEDSKGRIWVGTNDNGVVVIENGKQTHLTYKDGLLSSSIRIFAEDNDGDVFIGTTAGVCFVDKDMAVHAINDDRLNTERVLKLDAGPDGIIYGQTKNGVIFSIENDEIKDLYTSKDVDMDMITTLLADPNNEGKVYLCTEKGDVYYGDFGEHAKKMKHIDIRSIGNIHWISYDCERVWLSSTTEAGYLDNDDNFHLLKYTPLDSGIEMMTSDYQGNMWFASSTQGVMKVVTNNFIDRSGIAGLPPKASNTVCFHDGRLYVGTDMGLRILDGTKTVKTDLTDYIGDARVRCLEEDSNDNLWISTFTEGLGLVCLSHNGKITNYTTDDGMASNEIRCTSEASDGSMIAGTSGGLSVIRNGKVVKTIDADSGINNTVFLTVSEGKDGALYAGTDGDGIYVISGDKITRLGMDDGLTSDVVKRIIHDEKRDLYWIITSNSIEIMKDGTIKNVPSFPSSYCCSMNFDDNGRIWISSSYGIYLVAVEDMVKDTASDCRLFTIADGLPSTPAPYAYCDIDEDDNLFIPLKSGFCSVNMNNFLEEEQLEIKTAVDSVKCDDKVILPNGEGQYVIPEDTGRISITPSILDFALSDPQVKVFLEGHEDEGISGPRSELKSLEYTGLAQGNYTLHIQVMNSDGKEAAADDTYTLVKKAHIYELLWFRIMIILIALAIVCFIIWRMQMLHLRRRASKR